MKLGFKRKNKKEWAGKERGERKKLDFLRVGIENGDSEITLNFNCF